MLKTSEHTNRPQAKGGQKGLLKVSVELKGHGLDFGQILFESQSFSSKEDTGLTNLCHVNKSCALVLFT